MAVWCYLALGWSVGARVMTMGGSKLRSIACASLSISHLTETTVLKDKLDDMPTPYSISGSRRDNSRILPNQTPCLSTLIAPRAADQPDQSFQSAISQISPAMSQLQLDSPFRVPASGYCGTPLSVSYAGGWTFKELQKINSGG